MSERPNVVFIFPDQWRGDALGCLGHPVVETPWIDSLANAGVVFTNAYSPAPSCIPARACLITGQTPSTCGRPGMEEGVPWRYDPTLMSCLRDDGYQTMVAGKTHFYPQMTTCGFEKMQQYEAKVVGNAPESDYHAWLARETAGRVQDTGSQVNRNTWIAHPWQHDERLHPNTWTMDASLDLLRRRDPLRPFFLQVGFNRPHPPLDPPQAFFEMYAGRDIPEPVVGDWVGDEKPEFRFGLPKPTSLQLQRARQAYYAQLTHIDHQVGRLIHFLRETRQFDNTWIVFASDHGEMLGDHERFGKRIPLEGSAKVPLFIKTPSKFQSAAGTTCTAPCNLSDIMPTILDAVNVEVPESVEGASLVPWVTGNTPDWREFIHGEHADREGWQYLTDGQQKYFWESRSGRDWFFDLANDPQEMRNLANESNYATQVAPWRTRLIKLLAARPQDGLSDGNQLIPGSVLPRTRPELKRSP